jgi:drug/metabolite transporter (DMT)-like permease
MPPSSPLRGIVLMLLSVGIFSVMDALVKLLTQHYHPFQVAFFRGLCAILPIGVMIAASGGPRLLATRHPLGHVLRSIVGVGALLLFFYAFAHMKLADVVAVSFAGPLFVTALSVPLLGEQVGWRRWSAVLVGFAGVVLVVDPGTVHEDPMALTALAATVCYALSLIVIRKLSATESNAAIVFYYSVSVAIVCGVLLPFIWIAPTYPHLALLVLVGLLGGTAQYIMVEAFRWAPVSVLVPFEYSAILWSLIFGYVGFDETPDAQMLLGVAIIVASGLYLLQREARRRDA